MIFYRRCIICPEHAVDAYITLFTTDTISEENLLLFLHQARNTQKTKIALRIHKSKDQRYACFFKSVDRLLAVTITVNRLKHWHRAKVISIICWSAELTELMDLTVYNPTINIVWCTVCTRNNWAKKGVEIWGGIKAGWPLNKLKETIVRKISFQEHYQKPGNNLV